MVAFYSLGGKLVLIKVVVMVSECQSQSINLAGPEDNSENPVRAEHAFPPPADVDSLRAYSLPVQSPLAFLGGPREARGQRPRFALPGGGRPRFARPAALRAAEPRFARLG